MKQLFLLCSFLLLTIGNSGFRYTSPDDSVIIVEGYEEINSLDELTKKFRGKAIYIDLWATWCGPCRREFQHKQGLLDFAKDKDLELVYISADGPGETEKWKQFIELNKIAGHHVLANQQLRADLTDRFYRRIKKGRKVLSLPTYIIVNKKGKVVQRDARRPSDGKRLYKQLSKALK
ncbi:MAG: TlpA disulfide reductase family protein [Bacteroidota bacterium]